jgi:hypothetical protein
MAETARAEGSADSLLRLAARYEAMVAQREVVEAGKAAV